MKRILIGVLALLGLFLAVAFSYRWQWQREARAQCESARPLIAVKATNAQVERSIGAPSVTYGRNDLAEIHRHFAGQKEADIQERLPQGGRMLVYSKSNSIMCVYLDADGKARDAQCFLQ